MTLPLLMLLTYRLYLQIIFIDRLMIRTQGFIIITLLLELVNLNLNVKKVHM